MDELQSKSGVYHYSPMNHKLELRCEFSLETWKILSKDLPANSFFIGITSIYWRG